MKKYSFVLWLPIATLVLFAPRLYSAIVLDPVLVSGGNAIDPTGEQTLDQDAVSATDEAVLEALPGFSAIQSFPGWAIQGNTNYIVFTSDAFRADVKSTYSGLTGSSPGGGNTSTSLRTSDGTSIGLDSGSTRTGTLTLDFGSATFDGTTVTAFDSAALAPTAVGFAICGLDNVSTNVTIKYYGTDDTTLLSTQTLSKASDPDSGDGATYGSDGYTGYQATGTGVSAGIGKVVITANQVIAGNSGIAIDDLAYNSAGKAYYMTPAGTGSMNGSNWANAFPKTQMGTTLNTTMQPGDTLFLGSGNYGTSTMDITSSGTATAYKHIIGVDTGSGRPVFTGSWARTNPASGTDHFINFGSTGTSGCAYWEIKDINLTKCQYAIKASDITTGPDHTNLILSGIDITLVRHGMYLRDVDNLTVEDCSVVGYSKHAFRLEFGCNNVTFRNCVADLTNGDNTWWDHSELYPFGFDVNDGGAANGNILFENCIAQNNRKNNQVVDIDNAPTGNFPGPEDVDVDGDGVFDKPYYNGDGFVVEGNTTGPVTFTGCISVNNEDGGYDIKAAATFTNCVAVGNYRGFRLWDTTKTLTNCVATFPYRRTYDNPTGAEGGEGIWIQKGSATVDYFTFYANTGTGADKDNSTGAMILTNSILSFSGASGTFKAGTVTLGTGTVTYRPGAGTDPVYVNPVSTWDGMGNDMDSITYGLTKGYNSAR